MSKLTLVRTMTGRPPVPPCPGLVFEFEFEFGLPPCPWLVLGGVMVRRLVVGCSGRGVPLGSSRGLGRGEAMEGDTLWAPGGCRCG